MPDYRKVSSLLDLSLGGVKTLIKDSVLAICDDAVIVKDAEHSRDTKEKMELIAEVSG